MAMGRETRRALRIVAAALAIGLAPPAAITPSAWAADNLVVPDGPRAGNLWSPDAAPPLVEILDHMAVTSPVTRVSLRKSAQLGYSQLLLAWVGYIADVAPARAMLVQPTVPAAQDFNREKLAPSIDASKTLRAKIRKQTSRSSAGSTQLTKRFPGGSLILTGANSAADLRSKTVKYALADEIDEWPLDLDGQGDPMAMLEARQISFDATGDWKRLEGSTPTVKGASRIDDAFEAGDQRYYQVPCPHCHEYQRLEFFPDAKGHGGLRFEKIFPHRAFYSCRLCGVKIEEFHKPAMVRAGRWVATVPAPGRHPSYHLDTLTSLFVTWDRIASQFLKSKDDPSKLKAFYNLWLGLAWEERGDAPEWSRLYARRDRFPRRTVPVGGLILTGGADVQANGIYYEVVAWGVDRQSWSIDIGFLEGDTADPDSEAWTALDEVYDRRYPDAYGNVWPVDAFAVDSGYNANVVYTWTRSRHRAYAVKGEDGWQRAAIASTPTPVDITIRGKRLRRGAQVWPVGTWSLKSELYAHLRKPGRRDGAEMDPPGYCHHSDAIHDERYFKQLTAEILKKSVSKRTGRTVTEWVPTGANHYHDCRIYGMAMAAKLGVGAMTESERQTLIALRTRMPDGVQGSLLPAMTGPLPSSPPAASAKPVDEEARARAVASRMA